MNLEEFRSRKDWLADNDGALSDIDMLLAEKQVAEKRKKVEEEAERRLRVAKRIKDKIEEMYFGDQEAAFRFVKKFGGEGSKEYTYLAFKPYGVARWFTTDQKRQGGWELDELIMWMVGGVCPVEEHDVSPIGI